MADTPEVPAITEEVPPPAEEPEFGDINVIGAVICEKVAAGGNIQAICREPGMPPAGTVRMWALGLNADTKNFALAYARALELRADVLAEEIVAIADDSSGDLLRVDNGEPRLDQEFVARSRLRVDARKWVASKLYPKRYGDRDDKTGPTVVNVLVQR